MFQIILLTLVTETFAGSSFSQGHIKYSDASGTKVDWKLYAPYTQFKSQLQEHQRRDSTKSLPQESRMIQPVVQTPVGVESKNLEPQYKPFSQVPYHLKQLLTQSYESQAPYVNPDAFLHQIPQLSFGEVIPRKPQPMDYQSRTQSTIVRTQDQREQQKEKHQQIFGEREEDIQQGNNQSPIPIVSQRQSFTFDKSVPLEIQQLLQYQAQIPYNVIANHIIYKPKTPFVPEPLLEDEVGPYKYRSRVYYSVRSDEKTNKGQEPPVHVAENRNRE